jgi:GT2 family glycosyltransferase
MDVSIVIPTWRGRSLLESYLPSVIAASDFYRDSSGAETEILVVEDAGGDDTIPWLHSKYGALVRAEQHERNQGFCAACNTGFLRARFPVVLLLNNDVRLEADCIAPLAGHFKDPDVFAVTGKIFNQKGDVFCNGGKIARFRRGMWSTYQNYDALPQAGTDTELLSFTAIGAFSAFDRRKFLEIGGFESLTAMVEDAEISYRAWKRGWRIRYEPRSVAYHDASQTMNRRYKQRRLDRISRRSRLWMHWLLLHDGNMFSRHLIFLAARILTGWIHLDWSLYWAVFTGLRNMGAILPRRRENRRHSVRSDRELLLLLERFYRTAPIIRRGP